MTRRSQSRLRRDRQKIPKRANIAGVIVDDENKRVLFTTNDILVNQLQRDGPRVARSFDRLAKEHIVQCSAIFGQIQGLLLRQMTRMEETSFKATAARLLFNASNSYVASIEVARHGYPRQYGAVARMVIETLATVIVLAIKPKALEEFHADKLDLAKCVGWAKAALPLLPRFWGLLSNDFVHIGTCHSIIEPPSDYTEHDEALGFLITSLRGNVLLLYIVADLIFSDEPGAPGFWKREGEKASFDPVPELGEWMEGFIGT